jgi:hypothetical protein
MFIEAGRVVRRRWALVAVLAGAASAAGVAPAAAAQATVVNCNTNPDALQPAITAAAPDETLLVTGTCTGPFTIGKNLALKGIVQAVLDGNQAGSTVTVGSGARVQLDQLTLTHGRSATAGGGIFNQGTLRVTDSTVRGNTAPSGPGGGIHNVGSLVVRGSTVGGNYSLGAGGGINNNGALTVDDSDVFGNSADNSAGIESFGIGITATVTHSAVHDNIARANVGGGIGNSHGTVMTLADSVVYANTARHGAGIENEGTMRVIRSAVAHNTAPNQGGGIYEASGTMTLTRSTVEHNTANGGPGSGGGIYEAGGTVTLDQSQVRDNNPDNCAPSGTVSGCAGWPRQAQASNSCVVRSTSAIHGPTSPRLSTPHDDPQPRHVTPSGLGASLAEPARVLLRDGSHRDQSTSMRRGRARQPESKL